MLYPKIQLLKINNFDRSWSFLITSCYNRVFSLPAHLIIEMLNLVRTPYAGTSCRNSTTTQPPRYRAQIAEKMGIMRSSGLYKRRSHLTQNPHLKTSSLLFYRTLLQTVFKSLFFSIPIRDVLQSRSLCYLCLRPRCRRCSRWSRRSR